MIKSFGGLPEDCSQLFGAYIKLLLAGRDNRHTFRVLARTTQHELVVARPGLLPTVITIENGNNTLF